MTTKTTPTTHSFQDNASRVFLQPILPLLDDPTVTEIMINGVDDIFIERKGKIVRVQHRFDDESSLQAAANMICQLVDKSISHERPRVDARLPDGSRVHILGPPVTKTGYCISIRRFPKNPMTIQNLIEFDALNTQMKEFLRTCVEMHLNLIVSGGTGSGKTSLLNAISRFIPEDERILVIEDTLELNIVQDHVVRLEARPPDEKGRGAIPIRDLFHSALRMRPDRVIIGEVRSGEALDLVQAMTSGHSGSLSTVHSTTPMDALRRMETLCLYASSGLPLYAVRNQVSSAIQIIVQTMRLRDGSRKITCISEVLPLDDSGNYKVNDIFRFKYSGLDENRYIVGNHYFTGTFPTFIEAAEQQGIPIGNIFSTDQ